MVSGHTPRFLSAIFAHYFRREREDAAEPFIFLFTSPPLAANILALLTLY